MPTFNAPITAGDPLHRIAYALAVEAPWVDDPIHPPPWMSAYIIPEIVGCTISEDLARSYVPIIKEGDVLPLTLVEESLEDCRVHRYVLGIPVKFIRGGRRDLIRISLQHLLSMFDIEHVPAEPGESRGAEHLILTLRRCVRHGTDSEDQGELVSG